LAIHIFGWKIEFLKSGLFYRLPFKNLWITNGGMSIEDLLKNCYLCRDLDRNELAALKAIASFRRVKKGEMIFFEGDPATGFFVLLQGIVRIYKASPDGKEYTLHLFSGGILSPPTASPCRTPQWLSSPGINSRP
jgi:CRP-like cAMP-binding protein